MQLKENNSLIVKLDEFIRKYYKNQLIRGLIVFAAFFLALFLFISIAEALGHFSITVRTVLFYLFLTVTLGILVRYIFIPLGHLYRFGKVISYEQASAIIGEHFPGIRDKLLNTLQLQKQYGHAEENALLAASIRQRTEELRPVPFISAINFKGNYRFLPYVAVPLGIILLLLLFSPGLITESSLRLIDHGSYYEKEAPFRFILAPDKPEVVQNDDYELRLRIEGEVLPAEVFVVTDGNSFKMQKEKNNEFSYTLRNVQRSFDFRFFADEFYSREYQLNVIARPVVSGFDVFLDYPAYTGKAPEKLSNSGDLTVPAGTRIRWEMGTRDVDMLRIDFADTSIVAARKGKDLFTVERRFLDNNSYVIRASNNALKKGDSINYQITVIPDLFPVISVNEIPDSLSSKRFYYIGRIEDDFGFKKLEFRYRFIKSSDPAKLGHAARSINLSINPRSLQQSFYYPLDLGSMNVQAGDELEYYFEVWDNDAVLGSKSSRSVIKVFKAPSAEQLEAKVEKSNGKLKEQMNDAITLSGKIEKDIKELQKKFAEKKTLSWDDKKQLQDLLDKHKKLETMVDEIRKNNKKNNTEEQEYKPQADPELLKKQQELEKLMDEVMDEEMKKMMKELQEMLKENEKDLMKDQLDKMEDREKELKKEMDRALELFKQLELEKKMEQAKEKMEKLAEEEKKLSEETLDKKSEKEELKQKQDELSDEFKKLDEEMKDIEKKNEDLEQPNQLPDNKQEMEDIKKDLQDIDEDLKKGDKKAASQKQKKVAEKMEKLAQNMNESMKGMQNQQMAEDYNALRQILENLIEVSFEQERIISAFKSTPAYNPQYVALTQKQRKLKDDAKIIEDSLLALSKRQMMIKSFINREIGAINSNVDRSIASLGKRDTYDAQYRQQLAMTSMNNLAVMLSEVLKNMQEDMQEQMGKSGQGKPTKKKGKDKKPSIAKMREMQEQLNKEMQKMKDGNKPGGEQGKSNSMMFSKMAAQQEMLRREMQRLQEEMKKEGKEGKLGDMKKTQELMDKTEKDLLNKKITPETIKRQQEILTRLLDHEKAEKEQEMDNKRESDEGKELPKKMPPAVEEYLRKKQMEQELLRTLPPDLNLYYRQRVKDYFRYRGA